MVDRDGGTLGTHYLPLNHLTNLTHLNPLLMTDLPPCTCRGHTYMQYLPCTERWSFEYQADKAIFMANHKVRYR